MQLSARPLFDTQADAALYVERGVEDHLRRSIEAGLNVLVLGERRSGKTSLVHWLARDLRQTGRQVVVLDGAAYEDERALLEALYDALPRSGMPLAQSAATQAAYNPPYVKRVDRAPDELDLLDMIEGLVTDLRQEVGTWHSPTPVFVVDGVPSAADAHQLFGRHRDLVWRIPVNWVVTGSVDQRASFLRPPADSFFETVVELGAIGLDTQRELLARRLDAGARVDPEVYRAESTPGDLIARGRALLLEGRAPADLLSSERLGAIERVGGRPAVMLVTEMAGLGAVSASDDRLQRRLGWTRSRLNQVLRSLEEAGYVRSAHAESTGPGRPQKLYELVEADDRREPPEESR